MGDIVSFAPVRALDSDGYPVAAAKAFFYESGTTTPVVVYSDSAETIAHPVPLVANGAGIFPSVFRSGVSLKVVIADHDGVTLPGFPLDPAFTVSVGGSGASDISFSATAEIPANNVQDAIERVQLNLVAPLAANGLGVTGDSVDIGNLDAINKPSGMGRFTASTTGTRPTGVGSGDSGTVWTFRETSQNAIMFLAKRGEAKVYSRALSAGVWGAWSDPSVV